MLRKNENMSRNVYSVTDITIYIKHLISRDFMCSDVRVEGELSNVKYHSSGHIYFTIKDAGAAMSCVMFAREASGLLFRLEDGQKVIAGGRIDVYQQTGRYQLYVSSMEKSGLGDLYAEYERLKEELSQMGMFDEMYKRPIPRLVRRLGVVTSETGAVRRDIEQVSRRRNPYVQIILCPVAVQGEEASADIARGIRRMAGQDVDAIIIGRGGGSIEDLWAFNTREVAEAIFECSIPVISAVGHETDTTIADFVADLRAPTPSAAAELAVADISKLLEGIERDKRILTNLIRQRIRHERDRVGKRSAELAGASYHHRAARYRELALSHEKSLKNAVRRSIERSRRGVEDRERSFLLSMDSRLEDAKERVSKDEDKLLALMEKKTDDARKALVLKTAVLDRLSPLKRLTSGYAYAGKDGGGHVKSVADLEKGEHINLYFADGSARALVENINEYEKKEG